MVLGSKSNSKAGATAIQVATNQTSLLVQQIKKCPHFEPFYAMFANTPGVKPVYPMEVGGMCPDSQEADVDEDESDTEVPTPAAPAARQVKAPVGAAAAVAPAAAASGGKGPAQFHMQPSKKAPKLDLGEAYMRAQQAKTESAAAVAKGKHRCDLVIALTLQKMSAEDISAFLLATGY
jgi:hypothetical protein